MSKYHTVTYFCLTTLHLSYIARATGPLAGIELAVLPFQCSALTNRATESSRCQVLTASGYV